jgi:hypothetical protein
VALFDRYLFATYSGAGEHDEEQERIRLWKSVGNNPPTQVVPMNGDDFSRDSLRQHLIADLVQASEAKQRVIFGLAFPFAWPTHLRGFAQINNVPWRQALVTLNQGLNRCPPLARPSRYCQAFNQFAQQGVFWCSLVLRAHQWGIPNHPLDLVKNARFRLTEQVLQQQGINPGCADAVGGQGAGVVGGKTICGRHQLALMVGLDDVAWWPFDRPDISGETYQGKHVGVESYPKAYSDQGWPLIGFAVDDVDDRDAWRSCRYVQHADRPIIPGRLSNVPNLPHLMTLTNWPQLPQNQIQQDGWILGVAP